MDIYLTLVYCHLLSMSGHQQPGDRAGSEAAKVDGGGDPALLLGGEAGQAGAEAAGEGELGEGGRRPGQHRPQGEGADGGGEGAEVLASPAPVSRGSLVQGGVTEPSAAAPGPHG
jgi:hypothetical protein